jgi:hypothetical protein
MQANSRLHTTIGIAAFLLFALCWPLLALAAKGGGGSSSCGSQLETCRTNLTTCDGSLQTCDSSLETCGTNLTTCEDSLATCQKFPATGQTTSYAPGDDGAIRAGAALSYTDNGDGTITDKSHVGGENV